MKYRRTSQTTQRPTPAPIKVKVTCPRIVHLLMTSLKQHDEEEFWRIAERHLDLLENDPRSNRRNDEAYNALEDLLLNRLTRAEVHSG